MSKYIKFKLMRQLPKTRVYHLLTKKTDAFLGSIKWFPRWRQYAFHPDGAVVFNTQCLKDIYEFIEKLKAEHKSFQLKLREKR